MRAQALLFRALVRSVQGLFCIQLGGIHRTHHFAFLSSLVARKVLQSFALAGQLCRNDVHHVG